MCVVESGANELEMVTVMARCIKRQGLPVNVKHDAIKRCVRCVLMDKVGENKNPKGEILINCYIIRGNRLIAFHNN